LLCGFEVSRICIALLIKTRFSLFTVEQAKRYRLIMNNNSGDTHPVHLHRHTFEVTKIGDKQTTRLMKDTLNMIRFTTAEIDFVADDPDPTLFHCHRQDHQDEVSSA
jgi:FtsP/CotA-like multicopper oxidase with cupredoxin domain